MIPPAAGEPWNGRKDIKVVLIKAFTPGLTPGVLCRLLIELLKKVNLAK
jgi:hypothetical protein